MSAEKLVISTYLQYILIALGVLLLFTFVRQLGGVLLAFFLAAVLAYVLNPLVRWLEGWRIPRGVAVGGVFLALIAAQQPEGNVLVPRMMGSSFGVHSLWVLFATLAATALYGIIGAVFAVPIATSRYLLETLLFEHWRKALVFVATEEGEPTCKQAASVETAGLRSFAGGEV